MFAPSVRSSSSSRREKPYTRKPKAMVRSGSLIGTIKNIVSAPLSWFATNQENFEDLGKRSRLPAQDIQDVEDGQTQHKDKRMRVDSPERPSERERVQLSSGGYLDPPPSSSQSVRSGGQRSRAETNIFKRRSSAFGAPPMPGARTMSVDPPSRYATHNRDPAMVPLPPGSPIRSSPARSVGPDDGPQRPRTPFKLRTSLTPQPTPVKPARRESSAPPPLSSLQTRPMFVRPPSEESQTGKHTTQKTVSLGSLADFSRASRAPSLDNTLNNLGHSASLPSQIASSASSDAILQPTKSRSEKAFRELEMYKTPILPSRYKDASAIPAFLRPKRAHVPIPMPKKGRQSKPSLGMSTETSREKGETTGHEGKPYARTGGVGKMLARRRAEEEEEQDRISAKASLARVDEEDEMDTDIEVNTHKRDVGVSTYMTSGSDDEGSPHKAVDKAVEADVSPSSSRDDPFSLPSTIAPGGRHQPYGRIGRTRIRDPGQRSVPLGRPTNRFSAVAEEDESTDGIDHGSKMDVADTSEKVELAGEGREGPAYEAPKGFSFAKDAPIVNHDQVQAKELPIVSLPFSLGDEAAAGDVAGKTKTKEAASYKPPVSAFLPVPQQSGQGEKKKDEPALVAPKVSVVPPTSDQSATVTKNTPVPSGFFASFSGAANGSTTGTEPQSTGIPNFFANSSLLTSDKAAAAAPKISSPSPSTTPSVAPATPVKDPENPLWNGNEAPPSAPPKLFAGAAKPFTFGAKPADSTNSSGPSVIPAPLFGGSFNKDKVAAPILDQKSTAPPSGSTVPPAGLAPSPFIATAQTPPAPVKSTEAENKPAAAAPSPIFNFGASASANAPKPLFGTGSSVASTTGFSMQTSKPAPIGSAATGQKRPFSFGASEALVEKDTAQPAQTAQSGASISEHKTPFSFGTSPMASATSNTSTMPSNGAAAPPKPLFGGSSGGFSFGSQAASAAPAPSIDTAKTTSPFAFGAQPSTPPAAAERGGSPFTFGTQAPSSTGSAGFSFTTPVKANGTAPGSTPSTPTNTSPFTFGAQSAQPPRPVTPPSKSDEGMSMEESPVQMDTGAEQKKSTGSITFGSGPTPANPFGQPSTSGPMFTFGAQSSGGPASNLFAPKDANKPSDGGSGFNFNRTSSAPAISTSFSFGARSDQSPPPATAFGTPSNPFGQLQTSSGTTSSPFTFGQQQQAPVPVSNPFAAPSQSTAAVGSTPSSPFQSAPQFTFGAGAPSGAPNNPFAFGSSAPSSPANGVTGLPQSSGTSSGPAFTFGQPNGSSGSTLFNIGAAPPSNPSGGTPGRQIKKLPRRGGPAPKR